MFKVIKQVFSFFIKRIKNFCIFVKIISMATKNLGQVSAILSKSTAPTNTKVIWRDTSVSPSVFKIWNGVSWVVFGSGELEKDVVVTADIVGSGIKQGDTVTKGTSLTEFAELLLTDIFEPDLNPPSFSMSVSGSSLRIIGSSSTFTLTFNFNRGSIVGDLVNGVWDAGAFQNPRAGASSSYTIDGVTKAGNTLDKTVTVAQGNNSYSGTVSYAEGPQPLNSVGENFNAPLPAGTSPSRSASFEGIYPLFASTDTITTATQQALRSMLSANNIQIDLVAESGGNKQFFDIPDAWLTPRPLQSVQFFNTVSGSFDSTNQLSTFTTSTVTKTIEGNSVGYTRYTNNQADRGDLLIRLIF